MSRDGNGRGRFGFITIRRRRDGSVGSHRAGYQAPDGTGRVVRDFPTRREAEEWLAREETIVRAHEAGITEWRHPSRRGHDANPTFHDWAGAWYREHGARHADGTPLAPATIRYKDRAYARLDDRFGRRRMRDITVTDVNRFLDDNRDTGMRVRNAYLLLRRIMREAEQPADGSAPVIDKSPCVRAVPPKPRRATQEDVATPEQLAVIRANMPDYSRISIDMAAAFGLRAAEICALQVRDVDLDTLTLHIRHSARRGPGDRGPLTLGDTKTPNSMGDMPIPRPLADRLAAHIRDHCDTGAEAMLIKPRNSRVLNPNTLREQFAKARAKAGRPDLRLHTLRATMITETVRQGAEPKETQTLGRHADPSTSMRYYQRTRGERRRREIIESSYRALMGGPRSRGDIEREIAERVKRIGELNDEIDRLRRLRDRLPADDVATATSP